jgi:hypothetical protein
MLAQRLHALTNRIDGMPGGIRTFQRKKIVQASRC